MPITIVVHTFGHMDVIVTRYVRTAACATVAAHFQLPKRILRVDRTAVVRIGIAVFNVSDIDPCANKIKTILIRFRTAPCTDRVGKTILNSLMGVSLISLANCKRLLKH